jgi:hypothetical protein
MRQDDCINNTKFFNYQSNMIYMRIIYVILNLKIIFHFLNIGRFREASMSIRRYTEF